ncbi:MAG: 30S ribosomal protein S13 [Thermoproteales archaeon]|nr:30S ribosomal protein S13 [Thermoproteales archaeon]
MSEEFKPIVRLAGVDLPGEKSLAYSIARIKGIGINTAYIVLRKLGISPNTRLGSLSESELKKLDTVLKNIEKLGLPPWILNRRKDPFLGMDRHLVTSDLVLAVRGDIEFMKKIRSWKGIRHMYGLKVRGQRTRTTGRLGLTVGVKRRSK